MKIKRKKYRLRILAANALAWLPLLLAAQPEILFERAVGSPLLEYGQAHRALGRDGYVIVGHIVDTSDFDTDIFLMRLDGRGEVMFQRRFGGERGERANCVMRTRDGGFAIAGASFSFGAGATDFYFIKTDAQGRQLWMRTFGGRHYDECFSVYELPNGRFSLAGFNWSWGAGAKDFYLVETDADGELIWQRTYGGAEYDYCRRHIPTSDGGFALTGYTTSQGAGLKDMYLVKVDSRGDVQWDASYGGEHNDDANDIIQTLDGGFALAGLTVSDDASLWDAYLVKTDGNGRLEWQKLYDYADREGFYSLREAALGGFYLLGYIQDARSGSLDCKLVRVDQHGNVLWTENFGSDLAEECFTIGENDAGVSIAGYTSFENNVDAYLIQLGVDPVENCRINMRRGWNLISSRIPPASLYMRTIWDDILRREHLFIVKDAIGRFFLPNRFSTLIFWDFRYGYQAKLTDWESLDIINLPVDVETEIPLNVGWNIAAYFPAARLPAEEAFDGIEENLIIAKDEIGRFYRPNAGFSNMGLLQRGKGYQLKVAAADTLIYPNEGQMLRNADAGSDADFRLVHFRPPEPTGRNMSLLINLEFGMRNLECLEVGVFTKDGLCVGAAEIGGWASLPVHYIECLNRRAGTPVLLYGISVWGDDPTTPEIDGAKENDRLTFEIWDGIDEQTIEPVWLEGGGEYHSDGFARCHIDMSQYPWPDKTCGLKFYPPTPNPFNYNLELTFVLAQDAHVQLVIYSLQGVEIARLIDADLPAGKYRPVWTAGSQPNGLYLARIKTQNETQTMKIARLK